MGDFLTRATVDAALALYVLALLIRLGARGEERRLRWARLAWMVGFICFLLHVVCAFHFVHHWSHDAAYVETARQTAEVAGLDWGGGIYANYVFALVWGVDAAWWWRGLGLYERRSRVVEWFVQGFMAFISFNATVVFGHGVIRWFGAAGTILLVVMWIRSRKSMVSVD